MKKDIMNLLKSKEGTLRINNISYLNKMNENRLDLEFDSINGVRFSISDREIKSRDYAGIIKECKEITSKFLAEVNRKLLSDMDAGYRNTSRKEV